MLRRLIFKENCLLNQIKYLSGKYSQSPEQLSIPSRPLDWKTFQLTNVIESKEEFKYVEKLIPNQVVPEPPKHDSYPTPSGWVPINPEKSSNLPYHILRTRFYNFPIYAIEREGGSRKLTKIRSIEGNIWVLFFFLFYFFCVKQYFLNLLRNLTVI